jgi:hypothetical protein
MTQKERASKSVLVSRVAFPLIGVGDNEQREGPHDSFSCFVSPRRQSENYFGFLHSSPRPRYEKNLRIYATNIFIIQANYDTQADSKDLAIFFKEKDLLRLHFPTSSSDGRRTSQ